MASVPLQYVRVVRFEREWMIFKNKTKQKQQQQETGLCLFQRRVLTLSPDPGQLRAPSPAVAPGHVQCKNVCMGTRAAVRLQEEGHSLHFLCGASWTSKAVPTRQEGGGKGVGGQTVRSVLPACATSREADSAAAGRS